MKHFFAWVAESPKDCTIASAPGQALRRITPKLSNCSLASLSEALSRNTRYCRLSLATTAPKYLLASSGN